MPPISVFLSPKPSDTSRCRADTSQILTAIVALVVASAFDTTAVRPETPAREPAAAAASGAEQSAPDTAEADESQGPAVAATVESRLPAARTTHHQLNLGPRTLAFASTAGAITLRDPQSRPETDIAFVAYALEDSDPKLRPVTFVVNGGPGASSAYLHLGALGPWLMPVEPGRIVPSRPVQRIGNPDTWLDFTDLVFVDPVGTGFSRLVDPDDRLRARYLSIEGDAEALADVVLQWLTDNDRIDAPAYLVGESYGGFRGPLIAEKLQTDRGVGVSGLILISPVLDFGWWRQPEHAPLPAASLLPSLAATAMEVDGSIDPVRLRSAEDYADGKYITDFLLGLADEDAVSRMVDRVTELTGLDREVVAQVDGRIDAELFSREVFREERRLGSLYDGAVAGLAPYRGSGRRDPPDPVLDALTAPLTTAMLALYGETLDWLPDRRYLLLNEGVNRAWHWGEGLGQPEVVSDLEQVLGLDPELKVLVAHGYTDLVTPYFASKLILRQLPATLQGRVQLQTYGGGHMFYQSEGSRKALRADARRLYP